MGFWDFVGDMAELPFKAARVPGKIIKAVDENTLDTGLGKAIDDAGKPISDVGESINDNISDLDD